MAIITKTKYTLHAAAILLFDTTKEKKNHSTKVTYFWKTSYFKNFQGTRLSGASVAPTSEVRAFTMLFYY
jgi:hypothetical protein